MADDQKLIKEISKYSDQIGGFAGKYGNAILLIFSQNLDFFCENQDFHENGAIAKTPIIPKEYQWFWRVDCPENAKSTKITEIYEFLWNFREYHNFM